MKTIKYLLIFVLSVSTFISCSDIIDDTERTEGYDEGPNLIGFTKAEISVSGISSGDEYVFELPMNGTGPTIMDATEDVTVNISVDPTSTAIEGTHFMLSENTLTFKASNNYINSLPITMLTEGILAPLAVNPYVILNVTDVTGGFVDNGRTGKSKINLLYLCFSNLSGSYDVEMEYTAVDGAVSILNFEDVLTETGDGQYRTGRVGHWTADQLGGTPGFAFTDICGVITIPAQNLVDYWANLVEGIPDESYVDADTGVVHFQYSVCYGGDCRYYKAVYTPK